MRSGKGPATDPWFQDFLHTTRPLNAVLQPLNTGPVQVVYTRIDRDARNVAYFHDFYYQVDAERYFYPASTVKLPMAAAALEKINLLGLPRLTAHTPYLTTATPLDMGYQAGQASSVAADIEKMLTLSSNTAFNRLYQFTGPCTLQAMLAAKGYEHTEIRHQLGLPDIGSGQMDTAPCQFVAGDTVIYEQPGIHCHLAATPPRHDHAGTAFLDHQGRLHQQPMNFSSRNRLPLLNLHKILQSIIFPDCVTFEQGFRLTDTDRRLLLRSLGQWPRQMENLPDHADYPDHYAKFLLPDVPGMRCFNKAGWAFGFLTDTAYFADPVRGIEFCLSATVAFHDGTPLQANMPEQEQAGKQWLKALGTAVYEYELHRPKKYYPDLQRYAEY